ncbi:MAG: nicotinate-nucleotide--dimethylbenzimidazole phosphoribosyltransferase, partial [Alphaproteobacteria bacterium]|nr:nicotinate-nucleotide--dimethylbenzimidazole phosphoribosyltransferase [Alphaproteobacteria bacterium]
MRHGAGAPSIESLDDLRRLMLALPSPREEARSAAAARQDSLTKPRGALGRLEELALWLAAWQGRAIPQAERIRVVVFAGN